MTKHKTNHQILCVYECYLEGMYGASRELVILVTADRLRISYRRVVEALRKRTEGERHEIRA